METKKTDNLIESSNKFNRQVLFIIFVFTLLLYSNSIKNNYALDDNYVTVVNPDHPNNPRIEKGIKGIPEIFKTHYVESGAQSFEYRPLVLVTFAIEYQFFGSNPHVSHFISVLLYALTCMLLYSILVRLLKNYNLVFPLLIVFLFIIHPIHTEVVDNIKCRDELLSFLFGLCGLFFFLKSIEIENKKWRYILFTLLFLWLALLCKKTAILFMFFIPLTAYFFTQATLKKLLSTAIIFFLAFIVYGLFKRAIMYEISDLREYAFFENPLKYESGFLVRIPVAFYTLGYYLKLLVFPYPLSCYYGYNVIPMAGWSSIIVWLSIAFSFISCVYVIRNFQKKNALSFGIFIFFIGILPFANFVTPVVGIVGDRFVYFASLGFCIMAAYFLFILFKIDISDKSKIKFPVISSSFKVVLGSILLVYSCLTISRNSKWKDELFIFRNDVDHFENSCNLHYLLGIKLYEILYDTPNGAKKNELITECKFHYKQAIELMQEGVQKYPEDFTSLNNIGMIYVKIFEDAPAAWPYFKRAMALNSKERMVQFNFALCYEKRNLPDSAVVFYEKMIAENTNYLPVYLNLHEIYFKRQAFTSAIKCDKKGILQIPGNAKLHINLGNALLLNKDTLNALTQFKEAVACEPTNIELRNKMNGFLINIRQKEKPAKLNFQ